MHRRFVGSRPSPPASAAPWVLTLVVAAASLAAADLAAAAPRRMLVVCAPGYPGTTMEARATMDGFARAAARAAGWKEDALGAEYIETLQGGVERLRAPDAAIALVTLPVYLQEGAKLQLHPRLQVEAEGSAAEIWSLVARKGLLKSPADLAGWEVAGTVGYAPGFVRGPVLGAWGKLPDAARIAYSTAPLSALRRAAAGEKIAVLLDATGAAALPKLPFAADLEVVARSGELPSGLLCTVADRLKPAEANQIVKGLQSLHRTDEGAATLKSIRVARFDAIDQAALDNARQAYDKAAADQPAAGDKPAGSSH